MEGRASVCHVYNNRWSCGRPLRLKWIITFEVHFLLSQTKAKKTKRYHKIQKSIFLSVYFGPCCTLTYWKISIGVPSAYTRCYIGPKTLSCRRTPAGCKIRIFIFSTQKNFIVQKINITIILKIKSKWDANSRIPIEFLFLYIFSMSHIVSLFTSWRCVIFLFSFIMCLKWHTSPTGWMLKSILITVYIPF